MEASETLHVIAEISVAFTGFAGIVGALARGQLSPAHRHAWLGFWCMIELGLATLFAALLPPLLHHLGLAAAAVWTAASGAVAIVVLAHLVLLTPQFVRARRGIAWPIGVRIIDSAALVTLIGVLITQSLAWLGVGFPSGVGGFLVGLYLLLLASALNFAILVYALLSPETRVDTA